MSAIALSLLIMAYAIATGMLVNLAFDWMDGVPICWYLGAHVYSRTADDVAFLVMSSGPLPLRMMSVCMVVLRTWSMLATWRMMGMLSSGSIKLVLTLTRQLKT